jgi:hypothetical protein
MINKPQRKKAGLKSKTIAVKSIGADKSSIFVFKTIALKNIINANILKKYVVNIQFKNQLLK